MNIDWQHIAFVVGAAFLASTVAAIVGTGGGVILLPALVAVFGVRIAVPIYTIAQFIGNLSRVGFNRRLIRYKIVAWFSLGAVPCALLGSWLFTKIPDAGLVKVMGFFLVASVVWRRCYASTISGFKAPWFTPIGAVFSLVSGIVGSAGPFLAPFYLAFGLTKGGFIGTEALGTAIMHLVKLSCYQGLNVMSSGIWTTGLLLGPIMIAGSYLGKRILDHIPASIFSRIIEAVILLFGLWFILK